MALGEASGAEWGDGGNAEGGCATCSGIFKPVMSTSTCTCAGNGPSPTMPMSAFMAATSSFTDLSAGKPKNRRSAATLSTKLLLVTQTVDALDFVALEV